jgi:GT2 family glycosyltransferase
MSSLVTKVGSRVSLNAIYPIYIGNNGYADGEIGEYLRKLEEKPEFRIWYCDFNLKGTIAKGTLVEWANTEYIFVIDDDIYIQEDTIATALKMFAEDKEIGAISFPLFDPAGKLQSTSGIIIDIKDNVLRTSKIPYQAGGQVVDGLPAGAFFLRKQLRNFFKWDTYYRMGFADLDKSLQIYFSNSGFKQYVSFDSYLVHDKVTQKENPSYLKVRRDYRQIRKSYLYFAEKWGLRLPMIEHVLVKYGYAIPSRKITMVLNYGIRKLFRIKG